VFILIPGREICVRIHNARGFFFGERMLEGFSKQGYTCTLAFDISGVPRKIEKKSSTRCSTNYVDL
jgi:hypothetical protein